MPPRQTNRISSKRPYLYVVGIICPPRFWLLYIYIYKRAFFRFEDSSRNSRSSLNHRYPNFARSVMESFDSNLSGKNYSDKIIVDISDSGNSKVTKNLRFQFEIETRSRISVCSGLRTSELESAVSGHATSILNINYLGDRVEAGSFTRATRVIAPSRLYICIHISVLKFSQSSAALGTETHARIFAVRRVPAINFPTDSPDTITN